MTNATCKPTCFLLSMPVIAGLCVGQNLWNERTEPTAGPGQPNRGSRRVLVYPLRVDTKHSLLQRAGQYGRGAGVTLLRVAAAALAASSCATSLWPLSAATCSAVKPSCNQQPGVALKYTTCRHTVLQVQGDEAILQQQCVALRYGMCCHKVLQVQGSEATLRKKPRVTLEFSTRAVTKYCSCNMVKPFCRAPHQVGVQVALCR
jgi:hypothetical protein